MKWCLSIISMIQKSNQPLYLGRLGRCSRSRWCLVNQGVQWFYSILLPISQSTQGCVANAAAPTFWIELKTSGLPGRLHQYKNLSQNNFHYLFEAGYALYLSSFESFCTSIWGLYFWFKIKISHLTLVKNSWPNPPLSQGPQRVETNVAILVTSSALYRSNFIFWRRCLCPGHLQPNCGRHREFGSQKWEPGIIHILNGPWLEDCGWLS